VQVLRGALGQGTGQAYVTFAASADAGSALQHFHGRDLAGKTLTVVLASVSCRR
jgi:hypothetical protein